MRPVNFALWRFRPSELKVYVVYRAGMKNDAADALYRLKMTNADTKPRDVNKPVPVISTGKNDLSNLRLESGQQELA